SKADFKYHMRNSWRTSSEARTSWRSSSRGRPVGRFLASSVMICVRVTRVRSWPVLASTTCTSLPWRSNRAISSRLTYWLLEESYNLRFPYFLMTTGAGFIVPYFAALHKEQIHIDTIALRSYSLVDAALQQSGGLKWQLP